LGQIHLDVARYHELGRFLQLRSDGSKQVTRKVEHGVSAAATLKDSTVQPAGDYDRASAWFHLDIAVSCGTLEAILAMADIYLGRQHTLLADISMEAEEDSANRGIDLMEQAADLGDRGAMLFVAEAYDTGCGLGNDREKCWSGAVRWYEKALDVMNQAAEDENNEQTGDPCGYPSGAAGTVDASLDHPRYALLARLAEIYRQGGHGLDKDPSHAGNLYNEAAEAAMEAMKGKLANKYYMLAEEAYGEVEEDDCEEG
jgi:elongation factor 2 kinase